MGARARSPRRDHVHRHCHLERLQAAGELGIAGARRPGDRREVAEASLALPGLDGLSAQAEIVVSVKPHEKRWQWQRLWDDCEFKSFIETEED